MSAAERHQAIIESFSSKLMRNEIEAGCREMWNHIQAITSDEPLWDELPEGEKNDIRALVSIAVAAVQAEWSKAG